MSVSVSSNWRKSAEGFKDPYIIVNELEEKKQSWITLTRRIVIMEQIRYQELIMHFIKQIKKIQQQIDIVQQEIDDFEST